MSSVELSPIVTTRLPELLLDRLLELLDWEELLLREELDRDDKLDDRLLLDDAPRGIIANRIAQGLSSLFNPKDLLPVDPATACTSPQTYTPPVADILFVRSEDVSEPA